ncbi:MAG: hypothetical protein H7Y11_13915 [Armatimonadetes bacterium]|nr:hypothetical protein [Anaerolineae bacterium]
MRSSNRFGAWMWITVVVLFMLATQSPNLLGILFIIAMIWGMLALTQNNGSVRNIEQPDRRWASFREPAPNLAPDFLPPMLFEAEEIEPDHVLEAITTAGNDPDALTVLPIDLGVLVYSGNREPEMHRNQPLPSSAQFVRPFVELELPRAATGRIRFELLDSGGKVVFADEKPRTLQRGTNALVSDTWLRLHAGLTLDGMWQMKVYADGLLLANHVFEWGNAPQRKAPARPQVQEDGEISPELRQIIAENRLQRISLDELLADQQPDTQDDATARRSQRGGS